MMSDAKQKRYLIESVVRSRDGNIQMVKINGHLYSVADMIKLMDYAIGYSNIYTISKNETLTKVVVVENYLRTKANDGTEDNLDHLPEAEL